MKSLAAAVLLVSTVAAALAGAASLPAIIPQPQRIERLAGTFRLGPTTRIVVDRASRATGRYLAARLRRSTGYPFALGRSRGAGPVAGAILLTTRSASTDLGGEGYELTATPDSVVIRAPAAAGVFYGMETLLQARMKAEGLNTEEQLQSYFIRRIAGFVAARHHVLIGWSEILQGGLARNAVVMDWIGGAREAASAGHDVIMSPTSNCYFDYYQSRDHSREPRAIGGYLPLRKVYAFKPIPPGLPAQDEARVLGGQANVWTEYISSARHLDYMIFPRLGALAEAVWSPQAARNWEDFQRRLKVEEERLDELGVNYRHDH
jgi:N-acetyl-beta-hexosaminidase